MDRAEPQTLSLCLLRSPPGNRAKLALGRAELQAATTGDPPHEKVKGCGFRYTAKLLNNTLRNSMYDRGKINHIHETDHNQETGSDPRRRTTVYFFIQACEGV